MVDVRILLERADLLLNQGRYQDAETALKQALNQDPDNDFALSILARCYLNSKRYKEGIETIQRAIALDPENSFYFYLLGFGFYRKDQSRQAKQNLEKAIQLNPYAAEYYGLLAYILIDEKKFAPALEKADEGLAVDAENTTCLNARSVALNKLGRTDAAIETMQDALTQDPDSEVTHATVGWNLLEKGKHKDATNHFLEALRIDPDYAAARSGLKEALKSKIPPYRWLLQYSFWVQNRGKTLQTVLPIALYFLFRLLSGVFQRSEGTASFAWVIGGVYLLIVVTSWSINSVANFFLLFNRLGKYALTNTERWSAIAVVAALVTGLAMMGIAGLTTVADDTAYGENLFLTGMICLSLALPLSHIEFPLRWPGKGWRERYALVLAAAGLLTLVIFAAAPDAVLPFLIAYGLALLIYNWTGIGR